MKVLILAYDEDSKMGGDMPKVLHKIIDAPMLDYVITAAKSYGSEEIYLAVDSCHMERFKSYLGIVKENLDKDNVSSFIDSLLDKEQVLILYGNTPLVTRLSIDEDVMVFSGAKLKSKLSSGDFLGGIKKLKLSQIECSHDFFHVETRAQLAQATKLLKERINNQHLKNGVTLIDPAQTYIGANVKIGKDTVIYPGCWLEGDTIIGEGCILGNNSKVVSSTVSDFSEISFSVVIDSYVGKNTTVGPFAYLRPHSKIGDHCKVGDFVEVKNSVIGDSTKISHLTYVGDSDVGQHVNFGCGTVTVNYNGKSKFRTTIGDNAFIGCNTNLVAPVTVGEGAYTAAGSTITKDVPPDTLAVARSRQEVKPNWKRPK